MSHKKKTIARSQMDDLLLRIAAGEKPAKLEEVEEKEFLQELLPAMRQFTADGFSAREIAAFLGLVSPGDVKKALKQDEKQQEAETGEKKAGSCRKCKNGKKGRAMETPGAPAQNGRLTAKTACPAS